MTSVRRPSLSERAPSIASMTAGLVPGTPVLTAHTQATETRLRIFDYSEHAIHEATDVTVADAARLRGTASVTWVDAVGLGDLTLISELCDAFDIHPLSIEDVADVTTRPKLDDYDDFLFLVLKMVHVAPPDPAHPGSFVESVEQVSFVLGPDFVITFQEQEEDVFEPVRERLRRLHGRIRSREADYLAYALVDALVDGLLHAVERVGERVEILEAEVLTHSDKETPREIHRLKQDLLTLRKALYPQRDALAAVIRSDSTLIATTTFTFLRDAHDHLVQITDLIGMYREMASGLMELHLSMGSHKMNEVMKLLTILAAIFVPLTFVTGVYGMNFQHMPELAWTWGYPTVWGVMILVIALQLLFFKIRGWI